jgi:excisionase family DNA binding protein
VRRVTTLYRFYDADGRLLYIGISGNPGRRFDQHAQEKNWWVLVARSTMEHFPGRRAAERAEAAAIVREQPLFNIAGSLPNPNGPTGDPGVVPATTHPDPSLRLAAIDERIGAERLAFPVDEAAEVLGQPPAYVHELIASGEIRHIRIGRAVMIPRSELLTCAHPRAHPFQRNDPLPAARAEHGNPVTRA